jgi:hypothetical protein
VLEARALRGQELLAEPLGTDLHVDPNVENGFHLWIFALKLLEEFSR